MIKLQGYKEITPLNLKDKMATTKDKKKTTNVEIAYNLKSSSQSVDNAFRTFFHEKKREIQFKTSDRMICKVCTYLGINIAIVENGTKQYYIKP